MRWIILVVGVVILAAVGVLVYVYTNLNSLVQSAIEDYGSQITGTAVRVGGVDISLTEGRGTLRNVTIANPPGYEGDYAFRLGQITLDIDPGSVTGSPVVVDEVIVAAPQVSYELDRSARSNIQVIQANIGRYSGSSPSEGGQGEAPAGEAGPELRLRVDRFQFSDGQVAADTRALGGKELDLKMPPLTLTRVGGPRGAPAGELGKQVLSAYVDSIVREVARKQLGRQVEKLLGKDGEKAKEKVGKALKGLLD